MKKKLRLSIVLIFFLSLLMASNNPPQDIEQKYVLLNELIKNYSNQTIFCLDRGEEYHFILKDQSKCIIKLIAVKDYSDSVINLIRKSDVDIEINGKPLRLICEPYAMPQEIDGIRIMADSTSGWKNIYKKVQFSVWDAQDPLLKKNADFMFPIKDYLLFSHEMQSHNQVVYLGNKDGDANKGMKFYHDYGIDIAAYDVKAEIICPVQGTVFGFWQPEGGICTITIKDQYGFIWDLGHFITVDPGVKVGNIIKKGQRMGTIGRKSCWTGNFSHCHLGVYLSEYYLNKGDLGTPQLNLYPWLVYIYQQQYKKNLYAVARPHRITVTGEKVILDASHCLSFNSKISSYKWVLPDGKTDNSEKVDLVFTEPGVYMAELWIQDETGNEDVDFCKIKVYPKANTGKIIPTIFMCYTPTLNINPNQEITFQAWIQAADEKKIPISVDFGDGEIFTNYKSYSEINHKFKEPGIHVVTANARYQNMLITQKLKVVVGK